MTVIQSASKWEFLMRLGLDPANADHQALYWLMKNESIRAYNERLRGNRAALRPEHRDAAPPYAANQFTETAISDTIARIEVNASASTRPLYARGRTINPNWVIRWMLYHVCRYRDARNKKAQGKDFHDDDSLDPPPPAGGSSVKPQNAFYDTAREGYRQAHRSR